MNLKDQEIRLVISINNPFVKNHLVQGQAILPGLAYIDMLFRIARTHGLDVHKTVLKNLTIFNSLIIGVDLPVELIISVTESQDYWEILIEGVTKWAAGMGAQNRKKYISAQLHHDQAVFFNQTINIEEIKTESRSIIDPETGVYAPARQNGLVHRDIMKTEGTIYLTDKDCIANLMLPVNQADEAKGFLFHPALIDGGAMASSVAISRILSGQKTEEQNGLFLPIFFESFSATELLNTECYARIPLATIEFIKDIIYCDIEFFNSKGKQVGILKRLTSKRVRSGDQITVAVTKTLPVSKHFIKETSESGENRPGSLQHKVTHIFSRYLSLKPDQIDPQKSFFDLGLESVHLLEIVKELEKLLNKTLNPTLMFEYNNIQEVIAFFETGLGLPSELQDSDVLWEPGYEFYYHEPYLQDHLVFGKPALMGITYPACIIEELLQRQEALPIQLDRLQFIGGPVTPMENEIIHVRAVFEEKDGHTNFRSEYYLNDSYQVQPCLVGQFNKPQNTSSEYIDIQALISKGKRLVSSEIEEIYQAVPEFKIGEMLKTFTEAYLIDQTTMLAKVDLTNKKKKGNRNSFVFDPLLLNSCYLSCIVDHAQKGPVFVPLMIESLRIFNQVTGISYIITTVNKATRDYISFDSMIINDTGEVAAQVINASLKSVADPLKLENAAFDADEALTSTAKKVTPGSKYTGTGIAVIGISGRYPGARNLEEFWKNLKDGKDCISEIPAERWDHSRYYDEDKNKPGKTYSKWGGFLEGVDQFDPLFFNIAPRDAEFMDPQERLFLECVYETLEDAGYTRDDLAPRQGSEQGPEKSLGGKVGVFVGVMNEEYQLYGAQEQAGGRHIALSGNPSSIANRISYFGNFHGPSVAIDTMCSSSLTAIHLACRSIRHGDCEVAIAGGVNLLLHPNKYLLLAQGKFVSSQGRCESFGRGGDGYVPGEGVGAVLLKPLAKAIANGDQIYGIIKGTAINHGGKTSGYSVPNPNAQADVISEALEEAGVDPRMISYLEAHGTGTSLGDPIEIAGLVKAFRKYTKDQQFCALGSAKSNIGHCESAAGIAGVTKVLLQLKNRQIAPSLHSKELNPNIDFPNTPFIVQQELIEWEQPVMTIEGVTKEYPRIAGISSFGAGGSNAHVVIEEFIPENQEQTKLEVNPRNPAIIVLSAKNEERLKEQAERLINAIRERQLTDADLADGRLLADMAYTLQVGREAMEERLAVVVRTLQELEEKLKGFLEDRDGIIDLYRGQVKRNKESLAELVVDEDMAKTVDAWINKRKYGKLLNLWIKGLIFDWRRLYGENYAHGAAQPRRISLPTYPFARERYWIPENDFSGVPVDTRHGAYPRAGFIHPLLHQNTSDLTEQRYSSTFTGREFFLADHVVMGQKVLPGVATLEMARAAVTEALGGYDEDRTIIRLKNVVWLRPILVNEQPVRIHIGLYPKDNGLIDYEVYSLAEVEAVVYSQGNAEMVEAPIVPVWDLEVIQAQCSQRTLFAAEVYNFYKAAGLNYGTGLQGIETVYVSRELALAKLSLPSSVAGTEEQFVLHPSIMDAALQASIGIGYGESASSFTSKLSLPFALEELEVYCTQARCTQHCTGSMWAVIQYSKGSTAKATLSLKGNPPGIACQELATGESKIRKLDIDLCDELGQVCARLKGFSARVFEGGVNETVAPVTSGRVMFEPVWKEQAVTSIDQNNKAEYTRHLALLCEPEEVSPESIETELKGIRCLRLQSKQKSIDKRFQAYTVEIFEEIQKILEDKRAEKWLVQLVVTNREEQRLFTGLSGILKTAQIENPKVIGQLIELEKPECLEVLIDKLKENSYRLQDSMIRYQNGQRLVSGWSEKPVSPETAEIPWKDAGVYLITGGAGGLGMIFAKEVSIRVKDAALVLTGRSPLTEAKQAQLKELENTGTKVVYWQVDICDRKAALELIRNIQAEFGKLDGIIHSAGVIRDNYIIKKTKEELAEVLAPKVTGLVNLDAASQDLSLDFMILFSSAAGSLGNPGQADYAAANAFMDAYAAYRNTLVNSGERRGRTLSINWPLWKEGGMRVGETVEKLMRQSAGMLPLQTRTGIQALYEGFASGRTQVMVMEGDIRQIRAVFSKQPVTSERIGSSPGRLKQEPVSASQELLREKITNYLKKLLAPVIKLPVERIEADTPLEKYGIDSVMVMQLTNQLEETFGSLSKTLFFEYQTIRELSGYFLESYREQIKQLIGIGTREALTGRGDTAAIPVDFSIPALRNRKRLRFTTFQTTQENKPGRPLDIAIIGVSGRYPQARNLGKYWKNLQLGKDCITEIPKERWDHSRFYDKDKNKPGKTYGKWGGFLDDVDKFDPLFFNISPREAEIMDPQERLFLECVYETLEDAGYCRQDLTSRQGPEQGLEQGSGHGSEQEGNVGVYVGVMYEEYQLYGAQEQLQGRPVALSGNPSSIANRVSYFCNFHGPSVAIDTMCSSSLTAIHMACRSIRDGGCELAVAGGVNVSIHPNKYLMLAQGKFASSKGRCESFGQGGDGYVPGEGVGAVLLKPLTKAIADGDHIYGVIKGTAINHGGKTNGYSVPNPNAQTRVIGQALREAGIAPRTISYIEAHGTGTTLGDPIEITGLVKAFQKYTDCKQFCAIGSVKSNIGHCESAAGIAGVTKVLLQLKNRQIVPSLHSEELNPNIDFLNTPFIVQQELMEWKRPVVELNGVQKEYPRIAGISAFGAGGSNAHVVIEEYIPEDQGEAAVDRDTSHPPALVVLSAGNEDRLKEQAERLLTAIEEQQFSGANLADIAYTLQVGREAMEERLAMIAGTIEELTGKLKDFISGRNQIEDFYHGQVKRNQETLSVFTMDEDLQKAVESWITKKKYGKILDLWVKGLVFDWDRLYEGNKPRRISLPTYPFARERYWIPVGTRRGAYPRAGFIHPLLHQNTSDLTEQRYSSTFTGEEFFFTDHLVNGQKVLPGAASLEMARAGIESASGLLAEDRRVIKLKNVVWVRPIEVDDVPAQVHIGIYPEINGEIAYEIYSLTEAEEVVYSQGSAVLIEVPEIPVLDLKALQAECNQRKLSGNEVYDTFKAIGLDYGPGYRGIEAIYVGHGLVLAKLTLPSSVASSEEKFILHPSIMDAALQAAIGIEAQEPENTATSKLALPFALQELEVYNSCTGSMWALLRHSKDNTAARKIWKLDIDLCDGQGNVCVRIKGYSARALEDGKVETGLAVTTGRLMLEPVWKEQAVVNLDGEVKFPGYTQQLVILCEPKEISPESIETWLNGVSCLSLQSKHKNIDKRFQVYTVQVFEEIRKILEDKSMGKVLVQIVFNNQGEQKVFAGLSGILKTAQLENPKLTGQLIELEETESLEGLIAKLKENARLDAMRQPMDNQIRYQGGKRLVTGWSEVTVPPETGAMRGRIPWKDGGVYLITGGAGGLGMIFATEIAACVKGATLVLTGRSPLGEAKQAQLKKLESAGTGVEYRQVDVCNRKAVDELIRSIQAEFGKLDGIIHSAGVLRDNYIIKKTKEELLEVLGPKVIGLANLDAASQDLSLDFMILFSSIAGSLGNPGQADYAAANAFMDAYAGYRNDLVNSGLRRGRTLSINWPLWQDGGMRVDETVEKLMRQSAGLIPLRTVAGIQTLYEGIASGRTQVMPLEGDTLLIRDTFAKQPASSENIDSSASPTKYEPAPITPDLLLEKVSAYLKKLLSPVIKLPVERIEADTPLEKYGIDSVMVMELTNQLEKTFGFLSKTLFFEYQTIRELSGYFLESHRDQLNQLMGIEKKEKETSTTGTTIPSEPIMPFSRAARLRRSRFAALQPIQESKSNQPLDIAIIGVSGRYPQAQNIEEFWENLQNGKDCITEIPKERWDHSRYYDEDKDKPGKTYSKWGGFLDDVDKFDPLFFNISPPEAEIMDPQERLFLECVYETLEDAGYCRQDLAPRQGSEQRPRQGPEQSSDKGFDKGSEQEGNIGVFVGVMYEEYQLYGAQAQVQGRPVALSGNPSSVANRVSYFCNFHGPSLAIDTMCSSSLTAIHLACQSIQRGGCELAIAGGVNVSIHPNKYLMLGQGKFASTKGRCESFGKDGDGYVPGEGVGAVLLKPLSKAIADSDQIYGIIKGTAINHGGKTNGYTVPNPNAQTRVIGQALREAGIDPRTISYIEAHGTGTSLGDPIEIAGLTKAFQEYTRDHGFCAIGSAKSNIGHCESAAGIAGLTKILLQMKHRKLVPSLHSKELNPNIEFSNTPFIVQRELTEWKRPVIEINGEKREYPRIAGISAFGAGGANAHVVIEEYVPEYQDQPVGINPRNPAAPGRAIIVLSAKNEERLKERARRLLTVIEKRQFTDAGLADGYSADRRFLSDMAYTLQVGREAMEERLALVVSSLRELEEKLGSFLRDGSGIEDLYRGKVKQGNHLAGLAADEEMRETVNKWIERQKYGKLLDLWVQGLSINWSELYGDLRPRRISLPAYPFARERYWIPVETHGHASLTRPHYHLRMKGFSPRRLKAGLEPADSQAPSETLLLQFGWREETVIAEAKAPEYISRLVILCEMDGNYAPGEVSKGLETGKCLVLQSKRKEIAGRFQDYALQVFEEIQRIFKDQPAGNVLVQIVVPGHGEKHLCSGLAGLLKTARSENPKCIGQLIEVDPQETSTGILAKLEENARIDASRSSDEIQIRYQDGKRWVSGWSELNKATEVEVIPWKDGGVYLITGGAGGLGLIFAGEIARKVKNATLILTGRSILSGKKETQIKELEGACRDAQLCVSTGGRSYASRITYRLVDVCDRKAVDVLIQSIKEEYGSLQGIIHSAGVIRDNYIVKKTKDEISEVLAPKVTGLVNLDQATQAMNLDFLILFSSISGITGTPGQADYATANAFMDAYAGYRNSLVASNQRHGRTLAINWPLWKEGGMRPDEESEKLMAQTLGLTAMDTRRGIEALYQSMSSDKDQVMVLEGDRQKLQTIFPGKPTYLKTSKTGPAIVPGLGRRPEMKGFSLEQCLEWDLKGIINRILRISRDKIDRDKNLAEFGFNSLTLNQLAIQLIKYYGISITPALFFGYSTVEKLTGYYLTEYYEAIRDFYREDAVEPDSPARTQVVSGMSKPKTPKGLRFITRGASSSVPEPIAIIGMSGRFPGARNIDEMWAILAAGKDMVQEIPPERFDWRPYYGDPVNEPGKTNCKWCGCIPGIKEFDPLFFEISPREAEAMDPRQRLLLQESWKALEDAGYGQKQIMAQKIGMFVGVEQGDYQLLTKGEADVSANNNAILAARLSYFLNLNGPVLAIDTACSSGLVAAHQSILSLRAGDCDTAIAAGVTLLLTPMPFIGMSQEGMLSGDGKCHTFGRQANGLVPAEAVAVVILKRLSRAKADGDPIYAVIKGTGINYDGKTNGITAPSGVSQTALLKTVYDQYRINPEDIEYIVTHGTGTKLGDPIEINALYDAFKTARHVGTRHGASLHGYCALTSTKTNFGHSLGASGLVSLISLVQAMRHETIPASLHCEQENDFINWQESPFFVNKTNKPWPGAASGAFRDGYAISGCGVRTGAARRMGAVSAFGMSGTNVHMVVESYTRDNDPGVFGEVVPYYLLAFSAKTQEALEEKLQDMLTVLENKDMVGRNLAQISYTLLEGRHHFNYRLAIVVQDREHAVSIIKQILEKEKNPNVFQGRVPREFTGQKAIEQYGQDLLKESRNLRENQKKYQEALFALAEFYCQGYQLNWELLFGATKPERIHLPTYPFAREHYWAPEIDNHTGDGNGRPVETHNHASLRAATPNDFVNTQEADELMLFEEIWQKEALTAEDVDASSAINKKTLICFLSDPEKQRRFAETISVYDRQVKIIFISQSNVFQKQTPQKYGIPKTDRSKYSEVFQSIREDLGYGDVTALLYLWPVEEASCIGDYSCLFYLLQALGVAKIVPGRIQLAAQFANGMDRCYGESWIGFQRSLLVMLGNTKISLIFQAVSEQTPEIAIEDWGRKLWAELPTKHAGCVLYQDGERRVYRIRPTTLKPGVSLLKPGGTYLITGGCGGLGLLFAEHLAKLSRPAEPVKLIITGRSPLNKEKQSKINALESIGSQVIYLQADVCDTVAMREGLSRAAERFGTINGVIHSAGIGGDQVIFENEIQSFMKVLAPKITGTLVLDELFKDEPLDFICYFSSNSAILGDFGCCDYAIGNRFLMAHADYRNRLQQKGERRGKAVVVNWPVWKDGTMGFVDLENTKMYLKTSGQRFLETDEGLDLFDRILAQNSAQYVVFAGQPKAVHRFLGLTNEPPVTAPSFTESFDDKRDRRRGRRPEMKGFSAKECLEWDLKWFINRLLKIPREKVEIEKNLAEFGFNSLGLTQFAIQLIKHFGIDGITPVLFYKYPTIERLAKYFLTEHQNVIEDFYREESGAFGSIAPPSPLLVPKVETKPQLPLRNPEPTSRFPAGNIIPNVFEPIAVIGMSGRFPSADTVEELWENLINGRNCISEIPRERWEWRDYYGDPQKEPNKTNSKWGGFVTGIDLFDPLFFEIGPKEAEYMDPKQRLFLEEAWHCLEDAGYMGERIQGKSCGVYVGVEEGDYGLLSGSGGFANSNQNAALPARIAYKLDLKGPNLALTASCSSGLVAVHQACQALRHGECEMALAGGVNLMITPMTHIGLSQTGMLSPDGQCCVFDRRANGMVPGEAVAVVLLKPLSKAVLDHDHIYGCIKASGVNYNGKSNGINAPNPLSQAELLQDIYDKFHINPEAIQYIIPHSLGSKLGDPIEIQVLTDIFGKYTDQKQFCAISSVKPLIGHTFAASGVVSLICMLMAIKNRTILAMRNYEKCNEYINFKDSPFLTNQENEKWAPPNNQPRMGAVSTTGTSGTNAHAVVEEYLSSREERHSTNSPQIIVLSAKNQERLRMVVRQMLAFVERGNEISLADMAYTLQVGRESMVSRLAMVVNNKEKLIAGLKAYPEYTGEENKTGTQVSLYFGDLENDPPEKVTATLMEALLQEKSLEKIAYFWVKGGAIPWGTLHEGEEVGVIPLPTYPFARERYWVTFTPREKAAQKAPAPDLKAKVKIKVDATPKREYIEPRNEIETALMEIFKETLDVESVSAHDNFFQLGGDSLAVVKALDLINEKLHQRVNVKDFYSYGAVAELGRVIKEGRRVDEVIDLNREAVLEEEIRPCGEFSASSDQSKIFLTGGTGFVGRFLLHDLLHQTEATIYCLVRAGSKSEAMKRIKAGLSEFELWESGFAGRIVPVAGDLSQPDLGIIPNIYRDLCGTIDIIYHCATYMNHLATYREMKNTNVEGAKRILRFACTGRQKMIHYISTLAVFNADKSRRIDETAPIEQEVHYNSTGYASGKWVAEKLMMLAWERGIPSNIYRLGLVTGDSQMGRCDQSQAFHRFLRTYWELGCYGYDHSGDKTTFTPVDFISNAIVYLGRRPEIKRIYHLTNEKTVDFIDLIKYYNAGAEKPLKIVSTQEFFKLVKEAMSSGKILPIVPIIRDILELSETEIQSFDLNSPETDLYAFRNIDPTWTLRILKEGGIYMPEINETLIKRYFDYIARKIADLS